MYKSDRIIRIPDIGSSVQYVSRFFKKAADCFQNYFNGNKKKNP